MHMEIQPTYICDWICKNWHYCPWQEVQLFVTKTHKYTSTIKFHCQNKVLLGGLLLLTAFLQPGNDPYEWSGSFMELWWESRGLCVTVKLRGVEWRSLLSLHYHFSWLSALCGPYRGLFHLFTFIWHFFMNLLPTIRPPLPSHCWARLILLSWDQPQWKSI